MFFISPAFSFCKNKGILSLCRPMHIQTAACLNRHFFCSPSSDNLGKFYGIFKNVSVRILGGKRFMKNNCGWEGRIDGERDIEIVGV